MKRLTQLGLFFVLVTFASLGLAKPPGGQPPGNITEDIIALQEADVQLQNQIDDNEERIFSNDDDIAALTGVDTQLQNQIDDNEERIFSNDDDIEALTGVDTQLQNQIDDNAAAIALLQQATVASPVIYEIEVTQGGSAEYCSSPANNPWGCYYTLYRTSSTPYVIHVYGENLGDNPEVFLEQSDSGEFIVGAAAVTSPEHISVTVDVPSDPGTFDRVRSLQVVTDLGQAIVLNAFKVES